MACVSAGTGWCGMFFVDAVSGLHAHRDQPVGSGRPRSASDPMGCRLRRHVNRSRSSSYTPTALPWPCLPRFPLLPRCSSPNRLRPRRPSTIRTRKAPSTRRTRSRKVQIGRPIPTAICRGSTTVSTRMRKAQIVKPARMTCWHGAAIRATRAARTALARDEPVWRERDRVSTALHASITSLMLPRRRSGRTTHALRAIAALPCA